MLLDLVNTFVLLLALSLIQGFVVRMVRGNATQRQLLTALLFASACLFSMTIQIRFGEAGAVDSRLIIICLGSLFGGGLVAVVSLALVSAYSLGIGAGNLTDISILLVAAGLALAWRKAFDLGWLKRGFLSLLLLGFAVHACAWLLLQILPVTTSPLRWAEPGLPLMILFSLATAAIGCLLIDIEDRAKSESALMESQALMSHHLENTPLAAISWDEDFRCTQWNKAAEKIFGYSASEAIGKNGVDLLVPTQLRDEMKTQYRELIKHGTSSQKINENLTRDGRIIVCEWYNTPIYNARGETIGIASLGEDITAKREAEALIWRQANYDDLTGLANRKLLQDRLEQEIRKANRDGLSIALLYLDLDQFKDVNDTLGHHVGDRLLQETARRLSNHIREIDTVARLGGDEFTIIMGGLGEISGVERAASAILEQIAQPFRLGDEKVYVSASIGITFYPQDGTQPDELLKNADQAMYAAKNAGRNCFQYFTPSMQEAAMARMSTVKDLHTALPNNEFVLHYQPVVDLTSRKICKGEALLRWQHPDKGLLTPDRFIGIAEETRLINAIGDWVYREALQRVKQWRQDYAADFQICINASPVQFDANSPQIDSWPGYLTQLNLPGDAIAIEITESLLMETFGQSTQKLRAFRDAGIQISLDDFGTGYSSLAYLKKFDIDYLKIDRSFVMNLVQNSDDIVLCHAMIAIAHKLGLRVVAEGIETEQQRALLESAGCDYGQGYLFARPVAEDEFEELLARSNIAD